MKSFAARGLRSTGGFVPSGANERLGDAVAASVDALTALLRGVENPKAPAIGHWSIRNLAVHLADVFETYPRYLDGTASLLGDPMDLTAHNEAIGESDAPDDLSQLADRIAAAGTVLAGALRGRPLDSPVMWHGRVDVPSGAIGGVAVTEAFVHGHDIAAAERRPWTITRRHVAVGLAEVAGLLPRYVNGETAANLTATFDLRIRGGDRVTLAFDNGRLITHRRPPYPRADCTISADPGAFLLIGYRRIGQIKAAATGKILPRGRKPWLALKLPTLIRQP
jgi:uncharacterized protein (TIGR03083 family)